VEVAGGLFYGFGFLVHRQDFPHRNAVIIVHKVNGLRMRIARSRRVVQTRPVGVGERIPSEHHSEPDLPRARLIRNILQR
jgi:hypothetical protein